MDGHSTNEQKSEDRHPETPLEQHSQQAPDRVEGERKFKITRQFLWGFALWYIVTGVSYGLLMGLNIPAVSEGAIICSVLFFLVQVIVLIVLFVVKERREAGWGVLSAIGVNLVISLIMDLAFNAACFVPFFLPLE